MRSVGILVLAIVLALAETAAATEKRPVPDYDGRGPPPTSAEDVFLWVPRLAAAPLYLTSEYLVRKPLGFVVQTAEHEDILKQLLHSSKGPFGIAPVFIWDRAVNPHFGAYIYVDTAPNALRLEASFGADYVGATLVDRITLAPDVEVAGRGRFSSRSDAIFDGIGPNARSARRARFEERRFEANAALAWGSWLHVEAGHRDVTFGGDTCCDDPSVARAAAMGWYALPAGLGEGGYHGPYARLELMLDTRDERPSTGFGASVDGELASDLAAGRSWVRAGAHAGGSVDLTGHSRVLSLTLGTELIGRLGGADPPFTELVALGGNRPLPGFATGQLLGQSEIDATLGYEWPIWVLAMAEAHVAVGNVFGPHLEGLEPGLLRMSAGIGVRSVGSRDHHLELMVAVGTEPLGQGFAVDTVRVVVGNVTGF